jgi:predicted alpha/beta hydrolase
MSAFTRLSVNSVDGVKIAAKHWPARSPTPLSKIVTVFVHQWGILGGCGMLMEGMARRMTEKGYHCITFDLRGVGKSSGTSTCYNQVRFYPDLFLYAEN